MALSVSLAVLFAALLHAGWNALIKGGRDVELNTDAVVVGAGLVCLSWLPFVPLPAPDAWPYLAASVAAHLAYYVLMARAYARGELSLAYPLMRGVAPLATAIAGALLLQEMPVPLAWLGIALIAGGIVLLSLRALDHAPSRATVVVALANAGVIATYTLIDGHGARLAGNAWSYVLWLFALNLLPYTLWVSLRRGREVMRFLVSQPGATLGGGALSAGAYAIAVWAMTVAPVAMVAALRETSVLFAALLGARLLRERLSWLRWGGVVTMLAGVAALKLA